MADFRLLGSIEVDAGHELIEIGPPGIRAVLAIRLIDAGRLVSMESLIDRLWPEEPPPSARASLYTSIARVRDVLKRLARAGGPAITLRHQPGGYRLDIDRQYVDLHRFHELLARRPDGDDRHRAQVLGIHTDSAIAVCLLPSPSAVPHHGAVHHR